MGSGKGVEVTDERGFRTHKKVPKVNCSGLYEPVKVFGKLFFQPLLALPCHSTSLFAKPSSAIPSLGKLIWDTAT
jgi:hypothetical protein